MGLINSDPPLTKVYLEPTTRCNLRCRACMRESWTETPGDMEMGTFRSFLESASRISSLNTVGFWGFGEPLCHPEIVEMIRRTKALGFSTEMISNALLLDSAMAEALVDAGLDLLVVSLDGADRSSQAEYRGGADLNTILHNLENLKAVSKRRGRQNPELGIEFVISQSNIHELEAVIALGKTLGVSFVMVSNLLPYVDSVKEDILYWMSTQDFVEPILVKGNPTLLLPALDTKGEKARLLRETVGALFGENLEERASSDIHGYCYFIGRGSVSISRDGLVSPCIALMHDHRCYVLGKVKDMKAYYVGDLRTQTLESIWNDGDFRHFRKRVRDFDFSPCASCGGCDLSDFNLEDCIGSPFPTCGGCLWAMGVLLCP